MLNLGVLAPQPPIPESNSAIGVPVLAPRLTGVLQPAHEPDPI